MQAYLEGVWNMEPRMRGIPPISETDGTGRDCKKAPVSVLVATYQEEMNIGRCLESVRWADQIFVVDSFSTDKTAEIAENLGAEVIRHEWSGYSNQKNWALDNLPFRNSWVLCLDADERLTDELAAEIREVVTEDDPGYAGYYVNRRQIFLGRLMKHCWWYPEYILRLFRREKSRLDNRAVHERLILDGRVGYLRHDLLHDDQRGLATWIKRLNRYSSLEAKEMYERKTTRQRKGDFRASFRGNWGKRRRAVKDNIWYRIPFRPLVRFVYMYLIRRGFLDGREGLIYCGMFALNDFLANAKLYELQLIAEGRRQLHDQWGMIEL